MAILDLHFGDEKLTVSNFAYLLLAILTVTVEAWFYTNYPSLQYASGTYLVLTIAALSIISLGFLIKIIVRTLKGIHVDFAVLLSSRPMISGITRYRWFYLLCIGAFVGTFFMLSNVNQSAQTIYTPLTIAYTHLQILDLSTSGTVIYQFFASLSENFLFFSAIPGFAFTVIYYLFSVGIEKKKLDIFDKSSGAFFVALVATFILTPTVFVIYHTLHYGFSDIVSTLNVASFGIEQISIIYVMMDLGWIIARHASNNIALQIFSQMNLTTFLLALFSSWVTWVFILALVGYGIFRYVLWKRNRRKKSI